MTRRRPLAALLASFAIVIALTGCVRIPFLPGGGDGADDGASSSSSAATAIDDTTWSGTDSDGDFWQFTFQAGGGLAFTYQDSSYDDDSDTWTLVGNDLTITIVFDEGTATMTGPFVDPATPISLDGQEGEAVWTLVVQPS